MSRIYSVRFLQQRGGGTLSVYVVPPGMRAVVRSVSWAVQQGSGSRVWVAIDAFYVFVRNIPGAFEGGTQDLRLVAYAGEEIGLATSGADIGAHLSGFLFADPVGESAGAGMAGSLEMESLTQEAPDALL